MKRIIAIVGTIGSGKTTAVDFFIEKGYKKFKLTQAIYEEADRRSLDRENRTILQDLGDELREKNGVDVLAQRIIEKIRTEDIDKKNKYVLDSIRNHNELIAFRNQFGDDLLIVSVDAPLKLRYKRAVDRKGQYKEQEMTFEEFKKNNDRDLGKGNADNEQNVAKCMEMADIVLINDDGYGKFVEKLEEIK